MSEQYYAEIRDVYRKRVQAMAEAVSKLDGVSAPTPQGAFYAMLELPVDDADRFARFMVTEFRSNGESVVVAPGPGFYADPAYGASRSAIGGCHP